jgi:hypothetical protein
MDQMLNDARAISRQAAMEAETEIRELSLGELDHVTGAAGHVMYLQYTFRQVFVS